MALDVLLTPRWFRRLDLGLAALRVAGVALLAVRLASPLMRQEPVVQTSFDAAVLLGPVLLASLLRTFFLWPRSLLTLEPGPGPFARVSAWPGTVLRVLEPGSSPGTVLGPNASARAGFSTATALPPGSSAREGVSSPADDGPLEVCPVSAPALEALGAGSWWGRYRVLVLRHGLHGALRRSLAAAVTVLALTAPIFALAQWIEFGAPLGQWTAEGPLPWLRTLLKTALSVSVSAVVWWGLLFTAVHLVWLLLCARRWPSAASPGAALWVARAAWVAVPLALLLRQVVG